MKKELLIPATICAMGLGTQRLTAASTNPFVACTTERTDDGKEKIDFQGAWPLISSTLKASVSHNMVCLTFSQNIGHVNVSLYDGNGNLVYSGMVDTSAQRMVVIPTSSSEGRCTLVVENTAGYAEGGFECKK